MQKDNASIVNIDIESLSKIDDLVNENIKNGTFPGAVVLVAKDGGIVYEKPKKSSVETIYDFNKNTSLKNKIAATSWGNPYEYKMVDDGMRIKV